MTRGVGNWHIERLAGAGTDEAKHAAATERQFPLVGRLQRPQRVVSTQRGAATEWRLQAVEAAQAQVVPKKLPRLQAVVAAQAQVVPKQLPHSQAVEAAQAWVVHQQLP